MFTRLRDAWLVLRYGLDALEQAAFNEGFRRGYERGMTDRQRMILQPVASDQHDHSVH